MTTNKPEVVAWSWDYRGRHMATTDYSRALELAEPPYPTKVEPLIRLADYQRLQADHERLQAECEKLRKDAERLDFMLNNWRKVVSECLPGNRYEVYVEEGFMGDKSYPAVTFTGSFEEGIRAARLHAIDTAMQKERNP